MCRIRPGRAHTLLSFCPEHRSYPIPTGRVGPAHYFNQGNWGREGVEYQIPARDRALPLGPENFDLYAEVIRMDGHTPELMGTEIWIDGQPVAEYRPRQDYYFLLGDNSANSKDSRYWGFVPDRYLLGKVFFVYWPPRRLGFVN